MSESPTMPSPTPIPQVPESVKWAWAQRFTHPEWDQAVADRLVSDPDMAAVWKRIGRLTSSGTDDCLDFQFFMYACTLHHAWGKTSKVTNKNARAALESIDKAACELADKIQSQVDVIGLATGSIDLPIVVLKAYRRRNAGPRLTAPQKRMVKGLQDLSPSGDPNSLPDMIELLRSLGRAIDPGVFAMGIPIRPPSLGAAEAQRNYCLHNLHDFFQRRGAAINTADLATIVNAMENDPGGLDASHVGHLLKQRTGKTKPPPRPTRP